MRIHNGSLKLKDDEVLVITTNPEGRHGKGNAKVGMKYGAIYGQAKGPMGRVYGIVTKDLRKKKHPSIKEEIIIEQIKEFYEYAAKNVDTYFVIPYGGKADKLNLNGYTNKEMADMFKAVKMPDNLSFEKEFVKLILDPIDKNVGIKFF